MKAGRARIGAMLVAAALTLTACGASDEGGTKAADEPYLIMMSTGADAGPVTDQLATAITAVKAGIETVNAAGGIAGRQVELVESPDNLDPTKALGALRAQIAKRKPDAYIVGQGSNVSTAVAPILDQNKILFMNSANIEATGDPTKNPLAFNLAASIQAVVEAYLPAFKEGGYQKIGILHGNSAYAKSFGEIAASVFKDGGYDVVGNEEYDSAALDMTAQISALKAAGPDVVVFNSYGTPTGYVLKGIAKLGWDVPLLGDTSVSSTPLVTQNPPEGLLGSPELKNLRLEVAKSVRYDESAADTNTAIKAISAKGKINGTTVNCLGYDAVMLIAAGAKKAGSSDAAAIAKALEDPSVTAAAGTAVYATYPYSATSHDPALPADSHVFTEPAVISNGQMGAPK